MQAPSASVAGETTLRELAALYKMASLLVTTDSGPMHLAAAVGTPVVALFGPTSPERTGPYGEGHIVIRQGLPCSPCFRKTCDTLECMNTIGVDEVLQAVRERLDNR
jgi:3-deoxy-D-manno-octulosonic-acid transferase/heptosyltransferase-1